MASGLIWRGDELEREVSEAAKAAIDETNKAKVEHARSNHEWMSQTGEAEGSIQAHPATEGSEGITGTWGSEGSDHFIYLELGTSKMPARPILRPTDDIENPKLVERIASKLR